MACPRRLPQRARPDGKKRRLAVMRSSSSIRLAKSSGGSRVDEEQPSGPHKRSCCARFRRDSLCCARPAGRIHGTAHQKPSGRAVRHVRSWPHVGGPGSPCRLDPARKVFLFLVDGSHLRHPGCPCTCCGTSCGSQATQSIAVRRGNDRSEPRGSHCFRSAVCWLRAWPRVFSLVFTYPPRATPMARRRVTRTRRVRQDGVTCGAGRARHAVRRRAG